MPSVKIQRECKCFEQSGFFKKQEYETIDEALLVANELCVKLNEEFCTKHRFRAVYEDGNMIIKVEMNG